VYEKVRWVNSMFDKEKTADVDGAERRQTCVDSSTYTTIEHYSIFRILARKNPLVLLAIGSYLRHRPMT
jgi:hypothetical protein